MRKFQFLVIPMILVSFLSAHGQENTKNEEEPVTGIENDGEKTTDPDLAKINRLLKSNIVIPRSEKGIFDLKNIYPKKLEEILKTQGETLKKMTPPPQEDSTEYREARALYTALALIISDKRCKIESIKPVGSRPSSNPIVLHQNLLENKKLRVYFEDGSFKELDVNVRARETVNTHIKRNNIGHWLFDIDGSPGFYSQIRKWNSRGGFCSGSRPGQTEREKILETPAIQR